MKKLFIYLITLALLVGCATVPNAQDQFPVEIQRATAAFDSVNNKIWGDIWEVDKPLSGFDLVRYNEILSALDSKRAVELKETLEEFDIQIIRGFENTFVFCAYSSKLGFAMCDDALCTGVEKQMLTTSPEIFETWWKELPLLDCPKF